MPLRTASPVLSGMMTTKDSDVRVGRHYYCMIGGVRTFVKVLDRVITLDTSARTYAYVDLGDGKRISYKIETSPNATIHTVKAKDLIAVSAARALARTKQKARERPVAQ